MERSLGLRQTFSRSALEDERIGGAKGQKPSTPEDHEHLQMCSDSCSQKFKAVKKLCTMLMQQKNGVDAVTQSVVAKARKMRREFDRKIAQIDALLWKTAEESTAKEVLDALQKAASSLEAVVKLENQLKGLSRSSKS